MAQNIEVISDALREIGVIAEIETASAEQGALGLRKLNDMMALWLDDGFDVGYYPQSDLTDECPIPAGRLLAVKLGLAIQFSGAPLGAPATPELIKKFEDAYSATLRNIVNDALEGANMDQMPAGQGTWGIGVAWDINRDQ